MAGQGIQADLPYYAFTPQDVDRLLTVTEDERKATGKTVDKVAEALRQGFHPQMVYLGGSYKKGTALRGDYDIDLVVFLTSFDPTMMPVYKDTARKSLTRHGVQYKERSQTPYCLKISCSTDYVAKPQLHFDLVFTSKPAHAPRSVDPRFLAASTSPENDQVVVEATKKHEGLRQLILLCKFWKSKQPWSAGGVTSFYIELVCIKALSEDREAARDLPLGFCRVLELLRHGEEVTKDDGIVRHLNRGAISAGAAAHECENFARQTLKDLYVFLAPSKILFTQRNVGAKFRDARSLAETACQVAQAEIEKREISMIRVVQHEGAYYTVDNRRLAVFRLLEFAGKLRTIKARVVAKTDPNAGFKKKFDTTTGGRSVDVRGTRYSIGMTAGETTYPFREVLSQHGGQGGPVAALPAMESDDEDGDGDGELGRPAKVAHVDRRNNSNKCTFDDSYVFAQGKCRNVYKGAYVEGARKGEPCVVKAFKTGSVFESRFFEKDMLVVDRTAHYITRFMGAMSGKPLPQVFLNRPAVWEQSAGAKKGQKLLVEPMIHGQYHNFNSNTGYEGQGYALMQALSHFSFHDSDGQEVLCDLQGGMQNDAFILTDPVVLSRDDSHKYGPTDLGSAGILNFMARHTCTCFCQPGWKKEQRARPCLPMTVGTTFK